ncbi:DegQ family serine endoprotease [Hyphococcus sp.]|uniref:DegQ family serine endoprotease n=1 Tax=Hyphococcus sp. TaxID=2038636 RepID=UPI003D0D1121
MKKSIYAVLAASALIVSGSVGFAAGQISAQPEVKTASQASVDGNLKMSSEAFSEGRIDGLFERDPKRGVITLAPLLQQTTDAVVNISVSSTIPVDENPLFRDPFFRRFFELPDQMPEQKRMSAGSGVIVDADKGYILTNHHVVDGADEIVVTLKDQRRLTAKLIGSDAATDIALIEVEHDRGKLSKLPLGDSDDVFVGDFVVAIGNPFGLGQTVTSGIVSATGRSGIGAERYEDFIQTDAPINPGNSGGALINTKGELIGVNTAIIAPGGGNVGIGFAVPANMARSVMDQLLEHGEVRRGRIGVVIQDVTPELAEALDLPVSRGAVVSQVEEKSPADKAGLEAGDVITAFNGAEVESSADLRNKVGLTERGATVSLTYLRDGKERTARVQIEEAPQQSISGDQTLPQLAGAALTDIPANVDSAGGRDGVYVANVAQGSPAWGAGLRPGDIIRGVNRRQVKSVEEFRQVTKDVRGAIALSIERAGMRLFLVIR